MEVEDSSTEVWWYCLEYVVLCMKYLCFFRNVSSNGVSRNQSMEKDF